MRLLTFFPFLLCSLVTAQDDDVRASYNRFILNDCRLIVVGQALAKNSNLHRALIQLKRDNEANLGAAQRVAKYHRSQLERFYAAESLFRRENEWMVEYGYTGPLVTQGELEEKMGFDQKRSAISRAERMVELWLEQAELSNRNLQRAEGKWPAVPPSKKISVVSVRTWEEVEARVRERTEPLLIRFISPFREDFVLTFGSDRVRGMVVWDLHERESLKRTADFFEDETFLFSTADDAEKSWDKKFTGRAAAFLSGEYSIVLYRASALSPGVANDSYRFLDEKGKLDGVVEIIRPWASPFDNF